MPGQLPDGELAPTDGQVPPVLAQAAVQRPLSAYVHIPFCASRCGYCDFTTYTPTELGLGQSAGQARQDRQGQAFGGQAHDSSLVDDYVQALLAEIALARRVLAHTPPLQTVFVGGGTPTLLAPEQLGAIIAALRENFGLADDVEITTEANPETITTDYLHGLRQAGFTRMSLGMQSAAPQVLQVLQRRHTPGMAVRAARMARQAGFSHVNLDLIYGTPGESAQDWADSLAQALDAGVDHISAYALIVEPGTRLAAQIRRGQVPSPDDDVQAQRYLDAENYLSSKGFSWYEVSNWAKTWPSGASGMPSGPGGLNAGGPSIASNACRHNLAYWRGDNWWGFGTGAHSHLGLGAPVPSNGAAPNADAAAHPQALRWWNVRHPRDYIARLTQGHSPAAGRERLSAADAHTEHVMLGVRLASGLALDVLSDAGQLAAHQAGAQGLLDQQGLQQGRVALTLRGRLLADAVVRVLVQD